MLAFFRSIFELCGDAQSMSHGTFMPLKEHLDTLESWNDIETLIITGLHITAMCIHYATRGQRIHFPLFKRILTIIYDNKYQ